MLTQVELGNGVMEVQDPDTKIWAVTDKPGVAVGYAGYEIRLKALPAYVCPACGHSNMGESDALSVNCLKCGTTWNEQALQNGYCCCPVPGV